MRFKNRDEASYLLLEKLNEYKGKKPFVLGIPRGALPMAKIIAEGLEGDLSTVLVHKIPAPGNEEFAIGSIGLSGNIHLMPYAHQMNISESFIQNQAAKQLQVLKQRQKQYGLEDPNYKDRIIIIVDDGIATGATVLAAIAEVRSQDPQKVIVASPVAAQDSAEKIREIADEVVILLEPDSFYAVGQFYEDFSQVSDEEVINILKK